MQQSTCFLVFNNISCELKPCPKDYSGIRPSGEKMLVNLLELAYIRLEYKLPQKLLTQALCMAL